MDRVLRPLVPVQSLACKLVARITDEISGERLRRRGDRLSTEQEPVPPAGVSHTVIRKAVAALKALGLVETRQGVGTFVTCDVRRQRFQIDPDRLQRLPAVLHALELRSGIEIEAAGLAAERRAAVHLTQLADTLQAISLAIACWEEAVEANFEFHRAIVDATGNHHFRQLLEALGSGAIPRLVLQHNRRLVCDRPRYLVASRAEQRALLTAIEDKNATRARHRAAPSVSRSGALSSRRCRPDKSTGCTSSTTHDRGQ